MSDKYKPLTEDQKHERLGLVGEKIIRNWLVDTGVTVKDSVDPYDKDKDFTADGLYVAVKTQIRFVNEDAYTFLPKHRAGLERAGRVFYVSVPSTMGPHPYDNCILEIDMKKLKIGKRTVKSGRETFYFKSNDPAVKKVFQITDENDKALLLKYTTSTFAIPRAPDRSYYL